MTTVQETLALPGGVDPQHVVVTIDLAGAAGDQLPAGYSSAGDTIVGHHRLRPDSAGAWALDLHPNADITPAGTRWRVVLSTPSLPGSGVSGEARYLAVPSSGPVDVADILDEAPGSIESSALAAHAAATSGVHGLGTAAAMTPTQVVEDAGAQASLAATFATLQDLADLPELRHGFVVAAGFADVNAIDVQSFTTSGTWTKPDGVTRVLAVLIAAGGGGASGYRDVEGTLRLGGGGGAAGDYKIVWIDPADLDATEAVTIGTGGAGGAARTTNGVGNPGTAGGDTILDTIAGDIRATGGLGGDHVSGLGPGFPGVGATSRGGYGLVASVSAALDAIARTGENGGGGSGASRTAANANVAGGNGGGTPAGAGGVVGSSGVAGVAGTGGLPGSGGGGGSTIGSSGGWAGGPGGYPGGGGGGGSYGNASNPANSGAGGAGADGYALIVSFR